MHVSQLWRYPVKSMVGDRDRVDRTRSARRRRRSHVGDARPRTRRHTRRQEDRFADASGRSRHRRRARGDHAARRHDRAYVRPGCRRSGECSARPSGRARTTTSRRRPRSLPPWRPGHRRRRRRTPWDLRSRRRRTASRFLGLPAGDRRVRVASRHVLRRVPGDGDDRSGPRCTRRGAPGLQCRRSPVPALVGRRHRRRRSRCIDARSPRVRLVRPSGDDRNGDARVPRSVSALCDGDPARSATRSLPTAPSFATSCASSIRTWVSTPPWSRPVACRPATSCRSSEPGRRSRAHGQRVRATPHE
jgi:hypothetical protein